MDVKKVSGGDNLSRHELGVVSYKTNFPWNSHFYLPRDLFKFLNLGRKIIHNFQSIIIYSTLFLFQQATAPYKFPNQSINKYKFFAVTKYELNRRKSKHGFQYLKSEARMKIAVYRYPGAPWRACMHWSMHALLARKERRKVTVAFTQWKIDFQLGARFSVKYWNKAAKITQRVISNRILSFYFSKILISEFFPSVGNFQLVVILKSNLKIPTFLNFRTGVMEFETWKKKELTL